jgi:hypothetical protein
VLKTLGMHLDVGLAILELLELVLVGEVPVPVDSGIDADEVGIVLVLLFAKGADNDDDGNDGPPVHVDNGPLVPVDNTIDPEVGDEVTLAIEVDESNPGDGIPVPVDSNNKDEGKNTLPDVRLG